MAKPRRKHPRLSLIEESPQGKHFISLIGSALGTESFAYAPIESLRDGTHIFLLRGPSGIATLVERKEQAVGNEWSTRYGVLFEPSWSPVSWQAEILTYRWDPWLHAKVTGDATVRDSPTRERYRVSDALRAESGGRKDRVIMRVLPFDTPARRVAGIPREVIDAVLAKHGLGGVEFSGFEADISDRGGAE